MSQSNIGVEPQFNRYTNPSDLTVDKSFLRERARSQYLRIQYYQETTPLAALDDVRMEVEESQRTFGPPLIMYMAIKRKKQEDLFTKFGLDIQIDLQIQIPTVLLEDAGLATSDPDNLYSTTTLLKSGDYFMYNNNRYDVIYCDHFSVFWLSTYYPMHFSIIGKRYRDDYGGLVNGLYNPTGPRP